MIFSDFLLKWRFRATEGRFRHATAVCYVRGCMWVFAKRNWLSASVGKSAGRHKESIIAIKAQKFWRFLSFKNNAVLLARKRSLLLMEFRRKWERGGVDKHQGFWRHSMVSSRSEHRHCELHRHSGSAYLRSAFADILHPADTSGAWFPRIAYLRCCSCVSSFVSQAHSTSFRLGWGQRIVKTISRSEYSGRPYKVRICASDRCLALRWNRRQRAHVQEAIHFPMNSVDAPDTIPREAAPHVDFLLMLDCALHASSLEFFIGSTQHALAQHAPKNVWRLIGPKHFLPLLKGPAGMVTGKLQANRLIASVDKRLASLHELVEVGLMQSSRYSARAHRSARMRLEFINSAVGGVTSWWRLPCSRFERILGGVEGGVKKHQGSCVLSLCFRCTCSVVSRLQLSQSIVLWAQNVASIMCRWQKLACLVLNKPLACFASVLNTPERHCFRRSCAFIACHFGTKRAMSFPNP